MPDPGLLIRPYTAVDEDDVIALWDRCGLTRPWNDPRKDIARKLTFQREMFFVATLDGTLVGTLMAGYEGHRGWLNYLGVDPARRGGGIARSLVAEAERALLALGCPKVNLQVRAGNAQAVDVYTALGYQMDDVVSLGRRLVSDL